MIRSLLITSTVFMALFLLFLTTGSVVDSFQSMHLPRYSSWYQVDLIILQDSSTQPRLNGTDIVVSGILLTALLVWLLVVWMVSSRSCSVWVFQPLRLRMDRLKRLARRTLRYLRNVRGGGGGGGGGTISLRYSRAPLASDRSLRNPIAPVGRLSQARRIHATEPTFHRLVNTVQLYRSFRRRSVVGGDLMTTATTSSSSSMMMMEPMMNGGASQDTLVSSTSTTTLTADAHFHQQHRSHLGDSRDSLNSYGRMESIASTSSLPRAPTLPDDVEALFSQDPSGGGKTEAAFSSNDTPVVDEKKPLDMVHELAHRGGGVGVGVGVGDIPPFLVEYLLQGQSSSGDQSLKLVRFQCGATANKQERWYVAYRISSGGSGGGRGSGGGKRRMTVTTTSTSSDKGKGKLEFQ